MLRNTIVVVLLFVASIAIANPRVPSTYSFADIKLNITDAARREIQESVDALHQSRTYFDKKLAKVNLYFPIIERVLAEENVPDDFKYLVIQESALIADAVSVSNAVGFWQFKEVSAKEVGLRVDRYIDERMHITASTHAAAKYLKKNNFFFDNWLYALLAYNTGPGGAEAHVEKKYMGKKKMEVNKSTHWYVKKFLAHKVAFENELGSDVSTGYTLYEYKDTENKSLDELASNLDIDNQRMADYNKWLRKGNIPSDKTYFALIPVSSGDKVALKTLDKNYKEATTTASAPSSKSLFVATYKPSSDFDFELNQGYPLVSTNSKNKVKVNGIPGFIATEEDELNRVTVRHGLSINEFVKFNEMSSNEEIISGRVYYLKAKKSKAKIHYHVVTPGEDAWSISQKYGIKVKKLLSKNRMREEKELEPGMVLWLRFIRPKTVPVEYRELPTVTEPINQPLLEEPTMEEKLMVRTTFVAEEPVMESGNDKSRQNEAGSVQSEYFFEEVNEGTEYIDETSFVDINNSTIEGSNTNVAGHTSKKIQNEDIYHIVKSGETLFAISRMYNASIGELRQWNDIDDLNVLKVGQRILIRNEVVDDALQRNEVVELTPSTHTVKPNETLYSIARKHGLSIEELMELNDKQDFNVEEGEQLIIKSSE